MKYRAFISYSHAADDRLAPAIQKGLHGFARPWYRKRAIHTFRDQTNLSIHPKLWGLIEAALDDSDYFLLLASPQSAGSKWVKQEVAHWLANRPIERLLIVVTDGEVVWDEAAADFDWTRTNALPRILQNRFTSEPLYLNLQWAKSAEDLSLRNSRFHDAIADLAATLHGKDKEDIVGDDVWQYRRTWRYVRRAIYLLVGLATIAGIGWWQADRQQKAANASALEAQTSATEARRQQGKAEINAAEARKQQANAENQTKAAMYERQVAIEQEALAVQQRNLAVARQRAAQSELALSRRHDLALWHALDSLDQAATAEGRRALARAILWSPQAVRLLQANHATALAFSRDGRHLAIARPHVIDVWDVGSWRKKSLCTERSRDEMLPLAISADGTLVAALGGRDLLLWNLPGVTPGDCEPSSSTVLGRQNITGLAFSADERWIAVGYGKPEDPGGIDLWSLARKAGRFVWSRASGNVLKGPTGGPFVPGSLAFAPSTGALRAIISEAPGAGTKQPALYEWAVPPSGVPAVLVGAAAGVLNADGSAIVPEPATTSNGQLLRLQDLKGGSVEYRSGSPLHRVAASSDGRLVAGVDGCVVAVLAGAESPLVRSNAAAGAARQIGSPDTFAAISKDGEQVDIWDLQSGGTSTLRADSDWHFTDVQLRRPQRQVVVGLFASRTGNGERLEIRPMNGTGVVWEFPQTVRGLLPFAISPDGRALAQGSPKVSIWNIDRRQRVATVTVPPHVERLALAPDAAELTIGRADGVGRGATDARPGMAVSVETWANLASGRPRQLRVKSLESEDDSFAAVRYSPDGRMLAASTLARVVLFGASPGRLNERADRVAFTTDGAFIATLLGQRISVWDTATQHRLVDFAAGALPVTGLWFSDDNRRLIYSNADGVTVMDGPAGWRDRARQLIGGAQPQETCVSPE
jgi:WD40 repeat protein